MGTYHEPVGDRKLTQDGITAITRSETTERERRALLSAAAGYKPGAMAAFNYDNSEPRGEREAALADELAAMGMPSAWQIEDRSTPYGNSYTTGRLYTSADPHTDQAIFEDLIATQEELNALRAEMGEIEYTVNELYGASDAIPQPLIDQSRSLAAERESLLETFHEDVGSFLFHPDDAAAYPEETDSFLTLALVYSEAHTGDFDRLRDLNDWVFVQPAATEDGFERAYNAARARHAAVRAVDERSPHSDIAALL